MYRRTNVFNKHIASKRANQLGKDADTTKGNRKHALITNNDYETTIKLSRNKTKVLERRTRQM